MKKYKFLVNCALFNISELKPILPIQPVRRENLLIVANIIYSLVSV